jgi:hypothetical protein
MLEMPFSAPIALSRLAFAPYHYGWHAPVSKPWPCRASVTSCTWDDLFLRFDANRVVRYNWRRLNRHPPRLKGHYRALLSQPGPQEGPQKAIASFPGALYGDEGRRTRLRVLLLPALSAEKVSMTGVAGDIARS